MVDTSVCSFCGVKIEPGTGRMHVLKDGSVHHFCSNKCHKNMFKLKRVPRRVKWSEHYKR